MVGDGDGGHLSNYRILQNWWEPTIYDSEKENIVIHFLQYNKIVKPPTFRLLYTNAVHLLVKLINRRVDIRKLHMKATPSRNIPRSAARFLDGVAGKSAM